MRSQARVKPDDTRARIIETADALFRKLGFAKTGVVDIAAELRMSPANVYRFFSSKHAIVEAICQLCLSEVEDKAWAVARSKAPAGQRLERLVLEILRYHKENLLTDQKVNEIVLVALEHSWDTIRAHKDVTRNIIELIVRDGIEAGEFAPVDPRATAESICRSIVVFTHPVLIEQSLAENRDLEADARASVAFLLRAITKQN
jgi:AcrR family transcriptional regulator